MLKKASRTNHRDAKSAEMLVRPQQKLKERCSQQFVQDADKKQRFLSNPVKIALYIAAHASARKKKQRLNYIN